MEKNSILLTMGMAIYNEEKHIKETIKSLLAQTYKDFILIISDNSSTDRTPEICKYYAAKDKRITFIRHGQNKGGFYNFKYVLDKANTPFFMLCGGHDKWHPQFVEKLLPIIKREKDLAVVYPLTRRIEFTGQMGGIYRNDDFTTTFLNKPEERFLFTVKKRGKCNIFYGIWRTKILKHCKSPLKPIVGPDKIILAQAALEGKFSQETEVLFLRRENRKAGRNSYMRQLSTIIGKEKPGKLDILFSRINIIVEYLKIIFRKHYSLSLFHKISLSLEIISYFLIEPVLLKMINKKR